MSDNAVSKSLGMVSYDVEEEFLRTLAKEYLPLRVDGVEDKSGLKLVRESRIKLKNLRVSIEKRRKDQKADALEWGRLVDGEAKRLTGLIRPVEEHLQSEEDAVAKVIEAARQERIDSRTHALSEVTYGALPSTDVIGGWSDAEFKTHLQEKTEDHKKRKAEEAERAAREAEERAKAEEARRIEAERQKLEAKKLAEERAEIERERAKLARERAAAEAVARENAAAQEKAEPAARMADHAAKIESPPASTEDIFRESLAAAEKRRAASAVSKPEESHPDIEKLSAISYDVASLVDRVASMELHSDSEGMRQEVIEVLNTAACRIQVAVSPQWTHCFGIDHHF